MELDRHLACWNIIFPENPDAAAVCGILEGNLIINWNWDGCIWDPPRLHYLLTERPAEFDYAYVTRFLVARASFLAMTGPFRSDVVTVWEGIAKHRLQFAAIYRYLFLAELTPVAERCRKRGIVSKEEARMFVTNIGRAEQKYREILEVASLLPNMEQECHGYPLCCWTKGELAGDSGCVLLVPPPVEIMVQVSENRAYRKVKPRPEELGQKILAGQPIYTFREHNGTASPTDREIERLCNIPKICGYPLIAYEEDSIQFFRTSINPVKSTLYVACADRTMKFVQVGETPPGSRPIRIFPSPVCHGEESVYLVEFDNGTVGEFELQFRAHCEHEKNDIPAAARQPTRFPSPTVRNVSIPQPKHRRADTPVVQTPASAARPGKPHGKDLFSETPPAARHIIQRGVNTWRVVFDGVELPGLGKGRGMFFVAHLAEHAGGDPIHALELEAKVSRFYRKECGLTELVDPDRDEVVPMDVEAVLMERDLNLDNIRLAELLREEERKAMATIENPKTNQAAKAEALKKVEAIGAYRLNRFGKNSSPATDAVRRVRAAIDRLVEALDEMTHGDTRQTKAVVGFAEYVRKHIRQASAELWPKTGLRSKNAAWQPGHFRCKKVEGVDWSVK